jgi:glycosyltransferase 2 family protein
MKSMNADAAALDTSDTKPPATGGRRRWMFWLRTGAGALLVAYLMRHTQWKPVEAAIQGLAWSHWIAALAIYLCSQVASGWRWAELARPLGFNFSRLRFMQLYFEGMFFNLCLPSSIGGDVLKAYWLAPTTAGRVLAGCTVLADRAVGVVGLCVIGTTALIARAFGISVAPALLLGVGLLVAALAAVSLGLRVWKWLAGFLPANGRAARLAEKLMPYHRRPEVLRRSIGWGMVVQGLNVLAVAEIGHAMGLGIPLGAYCIAVPAVALLTCLPVSIGGVGVREGGLAWMLASYGVSEEMGVTLGLLWFLTAITGGMVGGLVYFCNLQRPYEIGAPMSTDEQSSDTQPATSSHRAA